MIGEASVRAGARVLDELLEKFELLKEKHPERLRKKAILVIYVSLLMTDLIEEAKEKGVWLFKATEELS